MVSQGSVATRLRCGEIFSNYFIGNLLLSLVVKNMWKSVNIWQSYELLVSSVIDSRDTLDSFLDA